MQAFVSFQPAAYVDRVTEDGHEMYKMPYPMPFFLEDGKVINPEFWASVANRLNGFQDKLDEMHIDLRWDELVAEYTASNDPAVFNKAVGKFLVTTDNKGKMGVHTNPIASVTFYAAISETAVSA